MLLYSHKSELVLLLESQQGIEYNMTKHSSCEKDQGCETKW